MSAAVPNFSAGIDASAFTVPGAAAEETTGSTITSDTNAITNDWSGVDSAINGLQGAQQYYTSAAEGGPGSGVAASQTRQGQQSLSTAPQTTGDLGRALMQLGQQGAQQAGQVGAAAGNEQMQFASQAAALNQQITQAQLGKYQSDIQLQAAQAQITNKVTQATNGLQLAQQTLNNQLQNAFATASNTGNVDALQASTFNMNQIFSYIGAGLGGTSSVAAAIGNYMNQPSTTGAVPTGGLTSTDAAYATNQAQTGNVLGVTAPGGGNPASGSYNTNTGTGGDMQPSAPTSNPGTAGQGSDEDSGG